MKKTIGYDYQAFAMQKIGGVSRYFCELMKHSNGLFNYTVGGIYSDNYYAKELGFHKSPPIKLKKRKEDFWQKWVNRRDTLKKLSEKCDIIHPTYYDTWSTEKTDKPIVITVYDMVHEIFPQFFSQFPDKKPLIEHSSKIIAISQNTKNDILRFYPHINPDKISVVYLGTSWEISGNIPLIPAEPPYVLFTGDRGGYKNFSNFISAVAPLLLKYDLKLKCSGSPLKNTQIDLLKQHKIFDRTSAQFANEDELKKLYANALCFVFPSLYEGFGIPILEAFACGCPLALSDASCFPEIADNAGIYFDPNSIENMREKIDNIISSETLRKDLISKGYERLTNFSWQKCAEQTAKEYGKLYL